MTTAALTPTRIKCAYRPLILIATAILFTAIFWFTSRYPALISKSHHVGQSVATMAYGKEAYPVSPNAPVWQKVVMGSVNWLDGMKIGMTFGILLGALLHTTLRFYPLKVGKNLRLNSLTGAIIGIPMGVCANCAVPTACGITRGRGRVEVALGFLFSSPNFNPIVVAMTLSAFPLSMVITKYALLLFVILGVVPAVIGWLEKGKPALANDTSHTMPDTVVQIGGNCTESFSAVFKDLAIEFGKNVWALVKPTVTTMVLASLIASLLLVLIPWNSLLSHPNPLSMGLMSLLATFMPVPIALDVMFAAHLSKLGIAPGYVMLFLTTLGTFSILPAIYLWREVSKPLAVILFVFFGVVGWILGMVF